MIIDDHYKKLAGEGVSPDHICGRCVGTGEGDYIVCLDCGATVDSEDFIN